MNWFKKSTFALTAAVALLVSQLLVVTAAISPDGFRQDQRINQLTLQGGTDTFATNNALGAALTSTARSQLQPTIDAGVTSGATSLLFEMPGLTDLTGTTNATFNMGAADAIPTAGTGYNGNSDLDWWYTPVASEVDAPGMPLSQLTTSIAGGIVTASGSMPFDGALGPNTALTMSGVAISAGAGSLASLTQSTGSTPGHLNDEYLDPTLQSFSTMTGGKLSGNISALSLSQSPIPSALTGAGCTQAYTATNTWLDLLISGCTRLVLGVPVAMVTITQPDQADPSAPVAGAGSPYQLVQSSHSVSSCKDHTGATVVLATCLAAAAYSSYFTFTTDRVIGKGPLPAAPPNLAATGVTSNSVNLSWDPSGVGYSVKQATPSFVFHEVASTTSTSATISGLQPATHYYFMVAAVNAAGLSTNSTALSVNTVTLAPSSLTASGVAGAIDVSWSAVAGATAGYRVKRSTVSGNEAMIVSGIGGTSYHDTGVTPGTTYYYLVNALNAGGPSADSPEASAAATPVANAPLAFTEFTATSSQPAHIITGPDGYIWYTSVTGEAVVQVDPATGATHNTVSVAGFGLSCQPSGIAIGSDRNIWVSCLNFLDSLIRIVPGDLTATKVGPLWANGYAPQTLTTGPDGNLWFATANYIARFNPVTHAIHRFVLPGTTATRANAMAFGPDGKLWFTEGSRNRIGRMTSAGVVTEFAIPTAHSQPFGIAVGPDENMYFTESAANQIGLITPSGLIGELPTPTGGSNPSFITVGPDGNLWFSEPTANRIGSATPAGNMQEGSVPSAGSGVRGLASGPDGNLWFTEYTLDKIGKVGVRHNILTLDKTAVAFGNVPSGSTTTATSVVLTNSGPDALAPFTPVIGAGGTGGTFAITLDQCNTDPIPSGSSCEVDVDFKSTGATGTVSSALVFQVDGGLATEQVLNVGLSATVIPATCDSVAVTPSVSSPQNAGTAVNLVATSAGCPDAPRYRFYLRNPAGVWSIVQNFGTNDTFAWNTTTYKPGTYLIGVWVRDAKSTKSYDAYAFGTFTLQKPACTSTNLSSDVASPQMPGATTVNFTATVAGCPNPVYQWWVRNAAGVWHIAAPFPSGDTFAWNTTGLADGTYQIGVWAKQSGSTRSYEAFAFVTYTLAATVPVTGTTHCQAVNVLPTAASPSTVGTPLTFNASAQGCDTPEYRWWVRDTATHWATVQTYP
ncbi:MAG: hypothetical protein QOJ11_641, partial [Frankiales bacterium]|nr:hypothetical protein [Frankiales bacterium]